MLSKKVVKYIQSLSIKKFRDEEGVFLAEGPKLVSELLLAPNIQCTLLCAAENWISQNGHLAKKINPENLHSLPEAYLEKISQLKTPNQVVAVFTKPKTNLNPDLKGKVSIMLDNLQDPGNMGTIIRIADWYGIENIICSEASADCFSPKVVQSTMGSILRVNMIYTSLNSWMEKHLHFPVYAAVLEGKSIYDSGKIKDGILLIGNESKGIQPEILKKCSNKITIPRIGHAESLNAAVATGIILSQWIGNGK